MKRIFAICLAFGALLCLASESKATFVGVRSAVFFRQRAFFGGRFFVPAAIVASPVVVVDPVVVGFRGFRRGFRGVPVRAAGVRGGVRGLRPVRRR